MSMEFLPRLFDSFSRERILCEKQKTSDTIFRLVSLVCVFRRCRYCLPLQGGCSYHIRWVVWIGWDYWSVQRLRITAT